MRINNRNQTRCYFIGELPPPFGGVAVKDKLVYQTFLGDGHTEMIDMVNCRRNVFNILPYGFHVLHAFFSDKPLILGIGKFNRLSLLIRFYALLRGKKALKKCHVLAMGGIFHESISASDRLLRLFSSTGTIWVETSGMQQALASNGLNNVEIFPNGRSGIQAIPPRQRHPDEALKCLFFSRICAEKGVDAILDAVTFFEGCNATVDFYGDIAQKDKEYFYHKLSDCSSFRYLGVFDATNGNVYQLLNQYDVLLLPTRWHGEGVPGVLVESKMAGITAIVSDWNFNAEVVCNGQEGIVLSNDVAAVEALGLAVTSLARDPALLDSLKQGSFRSRKRYELEQYRDTIMEPLRNTGY